MIGVGTPHAVGVRVDAHPQPSPETPPAHVAPATRSQSKLTKSDGRMPLVYAESMLGFGFGRSGLAVGALLDADVYPLYFIGIGAEASAAASSNIIGFLGPSFHDWALGRRLRLSVRLPIPGFGSVSATAAFGTADFRLHRSYELPPCGQAAHHYTPENDYDPVYDERCDDRLIPLFPKYRHTNELGSVASAAGEVAVRVRFGQVFTGALLARVEVEKPVVYGIMGASLGVGF